MTVLSVSGMTKGDYLQVGAGAEVEIVKVHRISGTGPYTVDVSPLTRWDRLRTRLRQLRLRAPWPLRRRARDWWLTRCDVERCWRRETGDGYCAQHESLLEPPRADGDVEVGPGIAGFIDALRDLLGGDPDE